MKVLSISTALLLLTTVTLLIRNEYLKYNTELLEAKLKQYESNVDTISTNEAFKHYKNIRIIISGTGEPYIYYYKVDTLSINQTKIQDK